MWAAGLPQVNLVFTCSMLQVGMRMNACSMSSAGVAWAAGCRHHQPRGANASSPAALKGKSWRLGLELSWAEYSWFTWRDLPEPVALAVPPGPAQAGAAAAGPSAGGASSSGGSEPAAKRPRTASRATSVGFASELPLDGSRRLVRVEGAACAQLNGIHRTTSKSAHEPKLADGRELAAADVAGGRVTAVTCLDFEGDQVGWLAGCAVEYHAKGVVACNIWHFDGPAHATQVPPWGQ